MDDGTIELVGEGGRWRTREVTYWAGVWQQLRALVPAFTLDEFQAPPGAPANPYMRAVVRTPRTRLEQAMPVGVVSNNYALVQHDSVVDCCLDALQTAGIATDGLRCELGLTELGEWMNLRVFLPVSFSYPVGPNDSLSLRLEVFNSVDGSSRLLVLFGWFRFVCGNGLIIGETVSEVRSIHNDGLDLGDVRQRVKHGLTVANADLARLRNWQATPIGQVSLGEWADRVLADAWGPKAACRVLSICSSGWDVRISDLSNGAPASQKSTTRTIRVPGSPETASTLFDVSQALSWVAKGRTNPEERLAWLRQIPALLPQLRQTP